MGLLLPDLSPDFFLPATTGLTDFCLQNQLDVEFEALNGQLWLKSNIPKERPIGIEVDETLNRHTQFFKKSSVYKDNLARALGIKPGVRPHVLDLTGGLLGDTLLMLAMGAQVTTLERHPVVRFLIESALHNSSHPLLANFQFVANDAASFLETCSPYDVIFFDPMFEDANHKAGPKKEMRIFREVVGSDLDAMEIAEKAQTRALKRLVIKRPRLSQTLINGECLQYQGKSTRYDVYLMFK